MTAPREARPVTDRHRERASQKATEILRGRYSAINPLHGLDEAITQALLDFGAAALADAEMGRAETARNDEVQRGMEMTAASVWQSVVSLLDSGTPADGLRLIAVGNAQSLRQRAEAARIAPLVVSAVEGERDGLASNAREET